MPRTARAPDWATSKRVVPSCTLNAISGARAPTMLTQRLGFVRGESEDGAVVIGIGVDVQQVDARRLANGRADRVDRRRLTAFADVRDAFDHAIQSESTWISGMFRYFSA